MPTDTAQPLGAFVEKTGRDAADDLADTLIEIVRECDRHGFNTALNVAATLRMTAHTLAKPAVPMPLGKATRHNHGANFGRKVEDCPRCTELASGAPKRSGFTRW